MAALYLLLAVSLNSIADTTLSPLVNNIREIYGQNKTVFEDCLKKVASQNQSLGCVDSFKYMKALCAVSDEINFKNKYKEISPNYFAGACEMSARGDNRLQAFFELDSQSCVQGFGSISERLMTYNRNRQLIEDAEEEKFLYMFEKNSCKDYQTYVNFCEFIDGANSGGLPKDNGMLPKVEIGKNPEELCKPNGLAGQGLYTIEYDLTSLLFDQKNKIFEKLILSYRSRMPAGKNSTFAACNQVRTGYENFGCGKFEKFADGEPIWRTPDEIRTIRLERDKRAKEANEPRSGNSGNSN